MGDQKCEIILKPALRDDLDVNITTRSNADTTIFTVPASGVGFDISCGVRTHRTGLTREQIEPVKTKLADLLYREIPVGVGRTGKIRLNDRQMDEMLVGGAQWAVEQGYGVPEELKHTERWRICTDCR
ncbi:MAG: hypothetical protein HKM94_03045 [Halobacteria archaeon]|nr:hypothetical protein [Halobacteria archaeon]